ncbi:MAG: GNAT family N-acetyltransferase [Pelatocladus maniniholoensis HA4357-MV3]|jgi:GNAT superfamily N-acetyltransferase|uniref:GNAT family N-acetyltransferase n=1 Tax=Pelatocladus maniniholoensis HA4357-MV3 TaxID=1117104 RepID=A0A9E3H7T2_9NOST|nr:GNAT family N-acetyltransferase [Pelatocladus maniniholoensis HA4357-MV3]BAZ65743.1 putative acetyltransferase [Fischerella sp. NIES-4106]
MGDAEVEFRDHAILPRNQVLELYQECGWSSAAKPDQLLTALANSHTVISAWYSETLVGLGNAISDRALVVYYPHLLVRPAFQRRGIGRRIIKALQSHYVGYHQQVLLAVQDAVDFYQECGFQKACSVEPMWIYDDSDV